jgi:hypothetical protein
LEKEVLPSRPVDRDLFVLVERGHELGSNSEARRLRPRCWVESDEIIVSRERCTRVDGYYGPFVSSADDKDREHIHLSSPTDRGRRVLRMLVCRPVPLGRSLAGREKQVCSVTGCSFAARQGDVWSEVDGVWSEDGGPKATDESNVS